MTSTKGEAHTLEGTYYYNVSKLILYKDGTERSPPITIVTPPVPTP